MTENANGRPKTQATGPRRFYKAVTIAAVVPSPLVGEGQGGGNCRTSAVGLPPTPNPSPRRVGDAPPAQGGGGPAKEFRLLLDGKAVRTPAKNEMLLPTRALADAVAAEWDAQSERIDPTTMPLTRLINSAIDGVVGREPEVRAEIVKYAGSDLVCYRAERPAELVRRQSEAWDPVLAWAREALGASFKTAPGIMPAVQPAAAMANMARALEAHSAFDLAALHVMTTLMGSALLALAHALGHLSADDAWAAAHVDEDWQISQWGGDAEAEARRERRWMDMQAASRLLHLLGRAM